MRPSNDSGRFPHASGFALLERTVNKFNSRNSEAMRETNTQIFEPLPPLQRHIKGSQGFRSRENLEQLQLGPAHAKACYWGEFIQYPKSALLGINFDHSGRADRLHTGPPAPPASQCGDL